MSTQGTPKDLTAAILLAIDILLRDRNTWSRINALDLIHGILRDRLAQDFAVAYMKTRDEKTIEILDSLWKALFPK